MVVSYGRSSQQVRIGKGGMWTTKRWPIFCNLQDDAETDYRDGRDVTNEGGRGQGHHDVPELYAKERHSAAQLQIHRLHDRRSVLHLILTIKNACVVPKVYYGKTLIMLSKPLLLGNSVRPDWQNFASLPKCYIFGNFWGFFRHLA